VSSYQFGIEEEYFVTDLRSRNVRRTMSRQFFRACKREVGDAVKSELLQSQIEVLTPPCGEVAEARLHLACLRRTLASQANRHGLGIVASGTHPLAIWPEQQQTQTPRYEVVMDDLQMLGRRNMLCGMHVHVQIPDPTRRAEVIYRAIPALPVLLALSTSSPFWQGYRTGLHGYRLAAYDELPRTGFPELFRNQSEYQHYVDTLVAGGLIRDASYIWWAIRPSLRYPTIELRVADMCTRLDDGLCIAAIFRCLMRHLFEHPELNANFDSTARAFAEENKWRAQRYGTKASFIDQRSGDVKPMEAVVGGLLDLVKPDAAALGCLRETKHALEIVKRGTSADEQLRIYGEARASGSSRQRGLKTVVDWLREETVRYLDDPTQN
jgi:carboxylate-amine ligase